MSSKLIKKDSCPSCREQGGDTKGDNLGVYDDGHSYCFACGYTDLPNKEVTASPKGFKPLSVEYKAIPERRISKAICQMFGYGIHTKDDGTEIQVASYIHKGNLVGQKLRAGKQFKCKGSVSNTNWMFGQHLWKYGGKRIVITEGEIDCLSVAEVYQGKWPVVSIPNGATGAEAAVKANLEFFNSYDEVVICFDMDEPGQRAAIDVANILRPGKAKIVSLPLKDANEMLKSDKAKELYTALWEARTHRPDGILHAKDVDLSSVGFSDVIEYPWPNLTRRMLGRRSGELVMHASGSGMGKSTVMRELIMDTLAKGYNVGVLMLEESCRDTLHDLMALYLGKPIKKILTARQINAVRAAKGQDPIEFDVVYNLTEEEYKTALEAIKSQGLYLYDHWGSLDSDLLIRKMEFMVTGLGCKYVVLDHVSIVVSGLDSGNERKDIDTLMTNLRQFVEQTECHVDAVCHLTKPKGTPFEEGGQISLRDFRGSGALYQLADGCFGYERNQQHPDKLIANTIIARSLKDRFGGVTGVVSALRYNSETGRLSEIDFRKDEEGNIVFDGEDSDHKYSEVFSTSNDPFGE